MSIYTATALAHPNIAFIKYWGNHDDALRLPSNGSISMNLEGLETRTRVAFAPALGADELNLNGREAVGESLARVHRLLDDVRILAGINLFARVESSNNFPLGTGLASSASGFAALALAGSRAAGLKLDEPGLSRLARRGSGSACRSIPEGFAEWHAGTGDSDSFAESIAPPDHWDLVDCIALVSTDPKATGSTPGNASAGSSPLQAARVQDAPRRLSICREAILNKDFETFADIVEQDSNLMHAVMMTSRPPLFYWQPATLAVLQAVRDVRRAGLQACSTVDAGPNVHVISEAASAAAVIELLEGIPGVIKVLRAGVGGGARLVEESAIAHSANQAAQ